MKPLTTKQRTISISILAFIFIILAPIIILYSFGYRIDRQFTLQKTGGIFIHSTIPNASVFLDDEYVKDNGLFIKNVIIQDLTPNQSYSIRVQKDGYQSWVKDIYVYPTIVTEARLLMLPEKYEVREIFPFIDSDGNGTRVAPAKILKSTSEEYISLVKLFEPEITKSEVTKKEISQTSNTNTKIKLKSDDSSVVPEKEVVKTKLDLFFESIDIKDYTKLKNLIINGKEVSWLDDSGIKIYWTDENNVAPYYYCGGEERICTTSLQLEWNDIKRFDYFPGRDDVWIVLTSTGIFAVEVDNRSQRNIQNIYIGENLDFRLVTGGRLIIKDKSNIFEINL
jgi:hypothetical protein